MRIPLRFSWLAAAALLMFLALAGDAAAAARGQDSERPRAPRARKQQAPLVWLEGVLAQDRVGAWMLTDGTPLRPAPQLRWREDQGGRQGVPSAGRTVRLMGQWQGSAFRVRQATLISQKQVSERLQHHSETRLNESAVQPPS